jgi:PAS domain S-box-containing protein
MKPRTLALVIASTLSFVAAVPVSALDAAKRPGQYVQDSWDAEDGMPAGWLNALVQAADGELWVGTQEGVARFDGVRFVHYNKQNTPAFKSSDITALMADPNGDVWIATRDGLVRWRKGEFRRFDSRHGLPGIVFGVARTPDGAVWASTRVGLVRFQKEKLRIFTTADGLATDHTTTLGVDDKGGLWAAGRGGTLSVKQPGAARFVKIEGTPKSIVTGLIADGRGGMWVSSKNKGLFRYGNEGFSSYSNPDGVPEQEIWSLAKDSDGNLWIGGKNLTRYDGKHFDVAPPSGDTDVLFTALVEDREHNFWLGRSGLLMRLKDGAFTTFTRREGLSADAIYSVAGRGGDIFVGSSRGTVNVIRDGKVVKTYDESDGLNGQIIAGLWPDGDGSLWIGTQTSLHRLMPDQKLIPYTTADGLATSGGVAMYKTRDGAMWIHGLGHGITRLKDGVVQRFTSADGLADEWVADFHEDRNGVLWVGTYQGLNRFDGKRFTTYSVAQGVPKGMVWSVGSDNRGSLWIGTWGGGMCRMTDGRFRCASVPEGLPTDFPVEFVDDGLGYFWISSNNGVFRVSQTELNDVIDGRIRKVTYDRFGRADGLMTTEFNGGQPGAWKADDGRIWFATTKGVTVVDPAHLPRNETPPQMEISDLVANGKAIDFARQSEWATGSGKLQIRYTGVTLRNADRVRFRYKLEGFDADWVDAGTGRIAYYTNVPAGNYRFRVRAQNENGVWSAKDATVAFRLIPPFYRTTWFQGLAVLASVGLVAGITALIHRRRIKALQNRQKELTVLVEERTSLLVDESRKTQLLLDSVGEGIFGIDPEGRLTFINPAGIELLGWQPEDIVGRPAHALVHPDEGECPLCFLGKSMSVTAASMRTKSGRTISVDSTLAPARAANGEVTGTVATFRDVSERLLVEQMKDEFVATVSHELRTPLTSMRSALGLLGSGLLAPEKSRRMVEIALSNSDRLIRLVNDILDVERMSSGHLELRRQNVDAAELMQQAGEVMQPMAEKVGVRIVVEPQHQELYVDPDRIIQTLTNLIGNAVKFSPPDSEVRLWADVRDEAIVVNITDHGRGIPREKLKLIFERFKQVDATDASEKGGAGLGLTISRGIVEAHGGTMTVASEVGVGTTISVTLPLVTPLLAVVGA